MSVLRPSLALCAIFVIGHGVASSQSQVGEQKSTGSVFSVSDEIQTEDSKNAEIRIEGGTGEARAAVSGFYRSVKADFRNLFPILKQKQSPINLYVKGKISDIRTGPATEVKVELLPDNTYLIHVGIWLHANFDNVEFERTLIQALLLDRMFAQYQGTRKMEGRSSELPAWMIEGVQELIKHRRSGRHSEAYAAIAQSLEMLPVREIIRSPKPPVEADSMTKKVYAASSAALVAALTELEDGSSKGVENLGQRSEGARKTFEFLAKLPFHEGDQIGLLRETFPKLRGSTGALDKWWALQIAEMGKMSAFEFYSWEDTRDAIGLVLNVSIPAEDARQEKAKGLKRLLPGHKPAEAWEGSMRDFDAYLDHPNAAGILRGKKLQFEQLRHRGFPLYRRIVEGYEAVSDRLAVGDKRGVSKLLEQLDTEFAAINSTMRKATDLMNHHEATQVTEKSPDFESYRRVQAQLERAEAARREEGAGDAFSNYLKELERELE